MKYKMMYTASAFDLSLIGDDLYARSEIVYSRRWVLNLSCFEQNAKSSDHHGQ